MPVAPTHRGARRIAGLAMMLVAAHSLPAQTRPRELAAEFFAGTAWNLRLPLTLRGAGGERTRFQARYSTRPLADVPYYAYRAGFYRAGHGGELELIHHKLYLDNPRPPIDRFEVTHGYNMLMANGVAPARGWQARLGVGLVLAHPEGQVDGRPVRSVRRTLLGGGYHLAGGALQLAIGRRYTLGRGAVVLTASPEAKLTAAFARMRVEQGTFTVPNVALHVLGGVGMRRRW